MNYHRIRIIRIGDSKVLRFASKELARYLKKAEKGLVVDQLEKPEGHRTEGDIVLKVCPNLPKRLGVEDPLLDDGYRIEVTSDSGVIVGTNERSVLMGVYRFLREIGFGFVRPGVEGERIPSVLPAEYEVRVLEKAAYRHRGICIEGSDTYENILETIDFLPKAGMNSYFIQFLVPGTFFERWYFHETNPYLTRETLTREDVIAMTVSLEEEIKERGLSYHKTGHGWTCEPFGIDGTSWDMDRVYEIPEETRQYLAELNGKRELFQNVPLNTQLCWSNPEVRDKVTTAITEYCQENSQVDVLHFWLADGQNNHCECENCRKKRPSDWYVTMLNELDDKMTTAGVNTRVVFLIYVDLLWKPAEVHLKNPGRFILMFAPITRNYGENYADSPSYTGELPPFELNHLTMPKSLSENMAHLKTWQAWIGETSEQPVDSFIYDYHLMWPHFVDPGYETCARGMFEDMKYLKAMGLNGNVSCQVQRSFFPSGLVVRALADALWNPEESFESMAERYYTESFREDGPAVHDYLGTVSESFRLYKDLYDQRKVTDPAAVYVQNIPELMEAVAKARALFEERLRSGDSLVPVEEWQILALHTEYVEKLAHVFELRMAGQEEEAQAAATELFDWLDRNELRLQKVLDIGIYKRILGSRFGFKY